MRGTVIDDLCFCTYYVLYRDECAVTQKIDLMMTGKSTPAGRQDEHKMPQIYYRKLLKGFADAVEPTPMQETWIENIIEV